MNRAFTLIELLIVVAIIGILSSIAVPNFLNAQLRAKLAHNYGSMKNIQTAIAVYTLDYNIAPIDRGLDAQNGITYISLTTPVAYMTSIDAFRDPFKTHLEEDEGSYFAYGGPHHIDKLDNTERSTLFTQANVTYFLFGWGPDRTPNWPWKLLGATLMSLNNPNEAGPNQDGGIFYSPSNGLVSSGDIVSTQALIVQ